MGLSLLAKNTSLIGTAHGMTGLVVVVVLGVVALWGLILAAIRRPPGPVFGWGFGVAVTALLAQVAMGLWAFSVDGVEPGNQHVFYGVVVSFTLAFAYIYRSQLRKRPALSYGLLALFMMGLGVRGIMTFGRSF